MCFFGICWKMLLCWHVNSFDWMPCWQDLSPSPGSLKAGALGKWMGEEWNNMPFWWFAFCAARIHWSKKLPWPSQCSCKTFVSILFHHFSGRLRQGCLFLTHLHRWDLGRLVWRLRVGRLRRWVRVLVGWRNLSKIAQGFWNSHAWSWQEQSVEKTCQYNTCHLYTCAHLSS